MISWSSCVPARRFDAIDIVDLGDFRPQSPPIRAYKSDFSGETFIPYCLDLSHRKILYTSAESTEDLMSAPFLYQAQRLKPAKVLFADWEDVPLFCPTESWPIFVFSPGRCGSTLFHAILRACGHASVSEPDFYTQISYARYNTELPQAARDALYRVLEGLTEDLCGGLANTPRPLFIKLRSECCHDPALITSGLQSPIWTVFMIRNVRPWAESILSVFGSMPIDVIEYLNQAIDCAVWLRKIRTAVSYAMKTCFDRPLNCQHG